MKAEIKKTIKKWLEGTPHTFENEDICDVVNKITSIVNEYNQALGMHYYEDGSIPKKNGIMRKVCLVYGKFDTKSDFVLEPVCSDPCNCDICKEGFWIEKV